MASGLMALKIIYGTRRSTAFMVVSLERCQRGVDRSGS